MNTLPTALPNDTEDRTARETEAADHLYALTAADRIEARL